MKLIAPSQLSPWFRAMILATCARQLKHCSKEQVIARWRSLGLALNREHLDGLHSSRAITGMLQVPARSASHSDAGGSASSPSATRL